MSDLISSFQISVTRRAGDNLFARLTTLQTGGRYHDERPEFVDDLSFGQGRSVGIDQPEEGAQRGPGPDLAAQRHVAVADRSNCVETRDDRSIFG